VTALEEKCRDLDSIVEEMGSTFMSFSDNLLKTRSVDPGAIRTTMEKFLHLSQRAARTVEEENDDPFNEFESPASTPASSKTLVKPDVNSLMLTSSKAGNTSGAGGTSTELSPYHSPPGPKASPFDISGSFDPFLNYSLWGRPTHSSSADVNSAIPYILAGRDSFASRLYFETVVLATQALRGEAPREILNSMFRYKLHYSNITKILAAVSGVLNVMLHGTSQDPGRSEDATFFQFLQDDDEAVKAAIVGEVIAEGSSESDYLTSWQVEGYLKSRWSLGVNSNAIRVHPHALPGAAGASSNTIPEQWIFNNAPSFAPTMIPGFLSAEQTIYNAHSLVKRLSKSCISIGAGPRWHFTKVDFAVQSFLAEGYTTSGHR
jgi:hypothetical protein